MAIRFGQARARLRKGRNVLYGGNLWVELVAVEGGMMAVHRPPNPVRRVPFDDVVAVRLPITDFVALIEERDRRD